jgi:serine/threonine protein kinase
MLLSRIGPIALEEPLGGSPDSNVLRGIHMERTKALAVKLLPRHVVDRPMGGDQYAEDVKKLQKLVHPYIARVLGGAMDAGQPYLVMELIQGESLRDLFDRRGRLPWETMVDIAQQICEALVFAHSQGLVHRRLTPSRVLMAGDGSVKLVGFDSVLGDHDAVVSLKAPMSVLQYLAPQEIRGKRSVGLESNDLFSLGVILYEGLCGEPPWPADTPAELIRARDAAPAPRASAKVLDLPVWLDVLVARLLLVKREGRFESADEARRAIVVARDKVAAGIGAAQHALSGKHGALNPAVDRADLRRLRKAATASKPKDDGSPIYERAWFLAACLGAVIALGVWFMWPLSEEALFAKAKPLMASPRPTDWQAAETLYLDEFRERFPGSKHNPEVEEFLLRNAIHEAEERIKNIDRFGRGFEFEIDRKYYEARRDEQIGDRRLARQKYQTVVDKYADSQILEERAVVELARQQVAALRASAALEEELAFAESSILQGELDQARQALARIVDVYDGNPDVAALVERARTKLRELDRADAPSK